MLFPLRKGQHGKKWFIVGWDKLRLPQIKWGLHFQEPTSTEKVLWGKIWPWLIQGGSYIWKWICHRKYAPNTPRQHLIEMHFPLIGSSKKRNAPHLLTLISGGNGWAHCYILGRFMATNPKAPRKTITRKYMPTNNCFRSNKDNKLLAWPQHK